MKKEFIVNRQGKDFVLYAGLIDQAHQEGLQRITTKLLQAPTAENGHLAICWAEVETNKGVFSGIGDASPENVGRMIAMHTVRMAETRAKARALRDAINVAMTAIEELADEDETQPKGQRMDPTPALNPIAVARDAAKAAAGPPRGPADPQHSADDDPATQAQWDKLFHLGSELQNRFGYVLGVAQSYTQRGAQIAITEAKAKGRELEAKEQAALASVASRTAAK